jgi:hypothetical protein
LKKAKDGAPVTVQTVNQQSQKITTTTTSEYEQKQFRSYIDWRLRVLSANSLLMRTKYIWTNSEDTSGELFVQSDTRWYGQGN